MFVSSPEPGPLDEIAALVAELRQLRRDGWSDLRRGDELLVMLAVRDRFEALLIALIDAWDQRHDWRRDAPQSAEDWLRMNSPLGTRDARRLARVSQYLRAHAGLAAALPSATSGSLTSRRSEPPNDAAGSRWVSGWNARSSMPR